MLIRFLAVGALAAFGAEIPVWGQVTVYNSFGAGNSYNTGIVWAVGGASAPSGYRGQAEFFVPGVSGYLSAVQLATEHLSGSALSNFYITADNGSGTPGTVLESFLGIQNPNGLLTLNSTVEPLLQAGATYWLCDEPATDTSYNGWFENSQNVDNSFAYERSEWGWSSVPGGGPANGVFRVTVTPVPEPTSLAIVAGGLALLALLIRKTDY